MSTHCDHVDISLECEKCYKILETLEDYLTKNKKSMKQNMKILKKIMKL